MYLQFYTVDYENIALEIGFTLISYHMSYSLVVIQENHMFSNGGSWICGLVLSQLQWDQRGPVKSWMAGLKNANLPEIAANMEKQ